MHELPNALAHRGRLVATLGPAEVPPEHEGCLGPHGSAAQRNKSDPEVR
jgi:hypothetical protein